MDCPRRSPNRALPRKTRDFLLGDVPESEIAPPPGLDIARGSQLGVSWEGARPPVGKEVAHPIADPPVGQLRAAWAWYAAEDLA